MLENIPESDELLSIMGEEKYKIWCDINHFIKNNYTMDFIWNNGGKTGVFELKYRKNGKTLCALYPREQGLCILIIFGKAERDKFEEVRIEFSDYMKHFYDNTHQYHDGKWLYIDVTDQIPTVDIIKLLQIKKKPNRKVVNHE